MDISGYAAKKPKGELSEHTYTADLKEDEVSIKITHCGICHSDIHLIDNDWGMSSFPFIPGHEIAGEVVKVGSGVTELSPGDRVGVGWQCRSCHSCPQCNAGDEKNCSQQQGTCVGRNGGYANGIIVDAAFAIKIPASLRSEQAAPMMCGGITSFTPVRDHVKSGMNVGVVGIGGLGHYAVLFASAMGANVTAISRSPDKEDLVKKLGAKDLRSLDGVADGTLDVIINTAPADMDWNAILGKLKPRGVLVQVGAAPEPMKVAAFTLIAADRSIVGSHIGNPSDIEEMLAFAAKHDLEGMVEEFPLSDVNNALDKVRAGDVQFRAVLHVE